MQNDAANNVRMMRTMLKDTLGPDFHKKEKVWPQMTPVQPWLLKIQTILSSFVVVEGSEENTVFSKRQLRATARLAGVVAQIQRIITKLPFEKTCWFDPAPFLRALVYFRTQAVNLVSHMHIAEEEELALVRAKEHAEEKARKEEEERAAKEAAEAEAAAAAAAAKGSKKAPEPAAAEEAAEPEPEPEPEPEEEPIEAIIVDNCQVELGAKNTVSEAADAQVEGGVIYVVCGHLLRVSFLVACRLALCYVLSRTRCDCSGRGFTTSRSR